MSIYESRLQADEEHIKERIATMGKAVQVAIASSVSCLLNGDRAGSYELILGDLPINRESRAIDALCHAFVARHLPSAGHLRFVSSVMRLNTALERVGDYAVTICREAVQLEQQVPKSLTSQLTALSEEACEILEAAMNAFLQGDEALASASKKRAANLSSDYDEIFRALSDEQVSRPMKELFALMSVFTKLERVSDQAKNICEDAMFAASGRTKPPKQYRVHFVDARNTTFGPLAVAIAKKVRPESGIYSTSGFAPGESLSPEMIEVAETMGVALNGLKPEALVTDVGALADHHVIVGLEPNVGTHIPEVPFQTVYLEWTLPALAEGGNLQDNLQAVARDLSAKISDLMLLMRGEEHI